MVERVIDLYEDMFLERSWIDRYSGLVDPVKRKSRVEKGFITEVLPMACRVNRSNCGEEEKYYMTPSPEFTSVAYWELLTEPTVESYEYIPNGLGRMIRAKVRFVIWYNKKKFGKDDCPALHEIDMDIMNVIGHRMKKIEDPPAYYVQMTLTDIKTKFNTIFAPYTYDVDKWAYLFQNPYGYRAFDYDVEVATNLECLPEFVPEEEIEC